MAPRRLTVLLLALLALGPARAQESTPAPDGPRPTVRCATRNVPPFAYMEGDRRLGFSIDLWQEIADRLAIDSEWQDQGTVADLLGAVREGRADVAVGAVSITAERQKTMEFSQPFFAAGLQVMVPGAASGGGAESSAATILRNLFSREMLKLVGIILVMVLIPAHLIWLIERRHPEHGLTETARYIPGIYKALWWSAGTLAAQADEMPRTYAARFIAIIWMFTSVIFIAGFTAQVTTSLTVAQLQGPINGPEDLPGKRVATTSGSTAEQYLKEHNAEVKAVERIEDAFAALRAKQVDAVVFDAPILAYYAAHEGKGIAQTVGPIFQKESYGLALPVNSPWRRRIDEALLSIREDGTYDRLYEQWFGGDETK